jgi:hypothetical protein
VYLLGLYSHLTRRQKRIANCPKASLGTRRNDLLISVFLLVNVGDVETELSTVTTSLLSLLSTIPT